MIQFPNVTLCSTAKSAVVKIDVLYDEIGHLAQIQPWLPVSGTPPLMAVPQERTSVLMAC